MTDRGYSALRQLRDGAWPALGEASERQRRKRISARVMQVQHELGQRGERHRRFALALALAAMVAGAGAVLSFVGLNPAETRPLDAPSADVSSAHDVRLVAGHASVREGSGLAPLAYGQLELGEESVLVTPTGASAELRLSSDTALSVAPATEVGIVRRRPTLDGFEERVRLHAGSVALRVPKLGRRGKISVQTSDTLVEVHGTRFSVRMVERPPLEPFTEVDVREGRVLVRSGDRSRFLGAGDHWSSERPEGSALENKAPARTPAPSSQQARRGRAPERSARVAASDLAAQNQLLEMAALAQKNGMAALALRRLDALIARYPDAELAHNARVERFRLLRLEKRDGEALAAAKAYLERHPDGFAREEAELLISTLSETAR